MEDSGLCLTRSAIGECLLPSWCGVGDTSTKRDISSWCRQEISLLECHVKGSASSSFHDTYISQLSAPFPLTTLSDHEKSNSNQISTSDFFEKSEEIPCVFRMSKMSSLTGPEHRTQGQTYPRKKNRAPAAEGQRKQRRKAANDRERRRMTRINVAFERLRTRLPHTPHRLSKHDILQMALSYISELCSLLEVSQTGKWQSHVSVEFMMPCTPLVPKAR
ncbi:protein Fer3-like [Portunus trituberculatus]|uniref:protein Fer3-like n=1 Tax=Portunus trituberculatus TaxID=210409 RepID=UPI001E1CB2C3|nr:protein Fer3-like [Portunus trituberculatus]